MKGPTICRFSLGMARRTAKPLPKSRTRGTTTSSSASHDLLSPSRGSAEGIQLAKLQLQIGARMCTAFIIRHQMKGSIIMASRGLGQYRFALAEWDALQNTTTV